MNTCRNCFFAQWFDRGGYCHAPEVDIKQASQVTGLPASTTFLHRINTRTELSYGNPHSDCSAWEPAPTSFHLETWAYSGQSL